MAKYALQERPLSELLKRMNPRADVHLTNFKCVLYFE